MKDIKLGFIGTGMIASATVEAFCNRGREKYPIFVANRTESKAKDLADKFPGMVTPKAGFQELVDECDIVVLTVLPGAGKEVIKSLRFRPEQTIVSFISTMAKEEIEPLLNCKVKEVVHIIPGTFVSVTEGPIIAYPDNPLVTEVFSSIGKMVALNNREEERALMSLTGMFAPIFSVEDTMISWCVNQGIDREKAAGYTSYLLRALADESIMTDAHGIHTLATVNTPGGINMQAVEEIGNKGGFEAFSEALDSILKRLKG